MDSDGFTGTRGLMAKFVSWVVSPLVGEIFSLEIGFSDSEEACMASSLVL
jgi:hypothetical protein